MSISIITMPARTKYSSCVASVLVVSQMTFSQMAYAERLKQICELKSEEKSSVGIRIERQEGYGYQGGLFYKGKRVASFQTGQANGYGSVWWRLGAGGNEKGSGGTNRILFFKGSQLYNSMRLVPSAKEIDRLVLVGLGAQIYYTQWRSNRDLLQAGAGFWRISNGCSGVRFTYGM